MLHSSKSQVYRKVAELKAPAEIQRAHSAHYGNVVPAAIKSLYHKAKVTAKGPGSQREGGGEVKSWREGGQAKNIEKQKLIYIFKKNFPPPSPQSSPVQGL